MKLFKLCEYLSYLYSTGVLPLLRNRETTGKISQPLYLLLDDKWCKRTDYQSLRSLRPILPYLIQFMELIPYGISHYNNCMK